MRTRSKHARMVTAGLASPVALVALVGPLAGGASADRPMDMTSTVAVVPGSVTGLSATTSRGVTTFIFTERSTDTGGAYSGSSVTTWRCVIREGKENFKCTGDAVYTGTYQGVTAPADVRLWATCSETDSTPAIVSCSGRYDLDGNEALEGLRGHGTFETTGIFNATVSGTNMLRLHDHR